MMNGPISAALVVMGAMVLFAGSTAERAGAQASIRIGLSATSAQDNGQQDNGQQVSPPPQNPDDTRRGDSRRDETR
jgi:hypothetical protein